MPNFVSYKNNLPALLSLIKLMSHFFDDFCHHPYCQKLMYLWIPQGLLSPSLWTSIQWFNWFKSGSCFHNHPQETPLINHQAAGQSHVRGMPSAQWESSADAKSVHVTLAVNCGLPNKPKHLFLLMKHESHLWLWFMLLNLKAFKKIVELCGL